MYKQSEKEKLLEIFTDRKPNVQYHTENLCTQVGDFGACITLQGIIKKENSDEHLF